MKEKKENTVFIKLGIPESQMKKIDAVVDKIPSMKRNQFIYNLVLIGLDDVKLLDSIGLIAGMSFFTKMIADIKESFKREELESTK